MPSTRHETIAKVEFSPFLPLIVGICRRTVRFVPAGITPNQITIASFLCVAGSGASVYLAGRLGSWWLVAVVGLYFLHWYLDNLDGTLARSRGQTSDRGFFLDLFLDALGYSAFFLGTAFSRYSAGFPLLALLILVLMRELLMMHWMLLRQRFVMPAVGPSELPLIVLLLAVLTAFWPTELLRLGGVSWGWIDAAAALGAITYAADIGVSAVRLYRALDPPSAG
jgi:phosphatidylglycerophosphate synthase